MSAPDPAADHEAVSEAVSEAAPEPVADAAPEQPAEPAAETPPAPAPESEAPEAPEAEIPESEPAPEVARRLPRAAGVLLAAFGLLAVTATSAAVTVAVGKPDHRRTVAAPAATAASAAPSAVPSATASPSAAPVPVPTITLAPEPTSTLHGTVDGSTHGGDLRYFLIPIPTGGESYGSSDGSALTMDDLAKEYSKSTDIKSVLDSYNYKESVYRQYRTADGQMEVTARLMRFGSRDSAKQFAAGATFSKGDSIDVAGDGEAKGWMFKPQQQAFTGEMVGISYVGDVEYEVTVDVKGDPDKALLADAMKRQRDRLSSGG